MPHDSLHRRLGGTGERYSDLEQELLRYVEEHGQVKGVEWCKERGHETSKASLSRWMQGIVNHNAEQAALDKLSSRVDRARKMRAATTELLPSLSPENLELIDQRIFEIQSAIDHLQQAIQELDPADAASVERLEQRRESLEGRMAFWSGLLFKLSMAANQDSNAKLAVEKFRETQKKNTDRALDALFAEIKGNAEAEALFHKFRAAVTSGQEAAA